MAIHDWNTVLWLSSSDSGIDPVTMSELHSQTPPDQSWIIAIAATFTAEPVESPLRFWLDELKLNRQIRIAPFNQIFQQLLDPSSIIRGNRSGMNVLLVRLSDWAAADSGSLVGNATHFVEVMKTTAPLLASPTLVCICPSAPNFAGAEFESLEQKIAYELRGIPGVQTVASSELFELYPVLNYYDSHADELGRIPYTATFFAALATVIVRKLHAARMTPYKVIVLDCDETLWKGACGEDGPAGVEVDEPRRMLQQFMHAQQQAGMLLCLCSKNNEEDVLETFRLHQEMPLQLADIVARRINWEPKSSNLMALSQDLDLALDSFIFVDDNPTECAEVQENCPEVLTIPLPSDKLLIPEFLRHIWAFDRWNITAEDRNRTASYGQRIERSSLEKQSGSLEEFLAALNLDVRVAPMSPEELPRVAQLTQRTNQMNCSTVRRTESEIQTLVDTGAAEVLTTQVSDRFGAYGLTGLVIYKASKDRLVIDTFLLSCRILGKGVEHKMLAHVAGIALSRGLTTIEIPYLKTARNEPAWKFLESIPALNKAPIEGGTLFRFAAGELVHLTYTPSHLNRDHNSHTESSEHPRPALRREAIDYVRIASALSDPALLLNSRQSHRQQDALRADSKPRTDTESRLAELWSELLHVSPIGIHDNFFDLGGHSLLAVQLLSRVHRAFGIDVSLRFVYSSEFTVAELAKAIEIHEIQSIDSDEYAALLKELEGLSDEEAAALLAEESEDPAAESLPPA